MKIDVLMPALSPTMEVGTLAKWLVKKGDLVKAGDLLAEIETDKAIMEFEAVEEGQILELLAKEGQTDIPVNSPIAKIQSDDVDEKVSNQGKDKEKAPLDIAVSKNAVEVVENKNEIKNSNNEGASIRIFATPLARKIAAKKNIDLSQIKGSGPRGRIIKSDLEKFGTQSLDLEPNKLNQIVTTTDKANKSNIPAIYSKREF